MNKRFGIGTLAFGLLSVLGAAVPAAHAAGGSGGLGTINPTGVTGSAGAGVVLFHVHVPADNFLIEDGIYGNVNVERGLGGLGLYLTLSLSYLKTGGQTNYSYTALNSVTYSGSSVNYDANIFQGGLGLRLKLLPGFFRPYVEGGGSAGYFLMAYDDSGISGGSDPKTTDGLLDFGYYAEGGAEINFSKDFGLRVAGRYGESKTKPFKTLGGSRIHYHSEVYYLSVVKKF